MLLSRTKDLGCETQYIQSSKDTIIALKEVIQQALHADIIITSGGISAGEKDFTKDAFGALGMKLFFEGIDIKPGKPTSFGKINNTIIINLPGNPLASMVNYEIFVRAIIRKMSGLKSYYHRTIKTTLKETLHLKKGKYAAKLGYYNGLEFDPIALQMPGMISPLHKANGIILTTPNVEVLNRGDIVHMIPTWCEIGSEKKEEIFTS